jgi:ubiquitin C-terminal hydrolase
MSFRWKGLLGVGGGGGAADAGNGSAGAVGTGMHDGHLGTGNGVEAISEAPDWYIDPKDLPNMLGFENFGNTCYVNSVMQALYFCDPFREALLSHESATSTVTAEPEQLLEETLYSALKTLFEQMASATVAITNADDNTSLPVSASTSNALLALGGGLSRKISSRPNTASTKPSTASNRPISSSGNAGIGAGALPIAPSTVNINVAPSITGKGGLNSCSTVVVADSDIKNFLGSLKKSNILFDSTAHQDAHELFNFVLNRIGEDIEGEGANRGDRKTLVQHLFEGIMTNETRCLTCETVTSRDECFLDLSLDIERNSSVTACLRQFSAREMLCARNKFFCDTCSGLQEAEKRMKIKKLPNVLALHLKRFKYEESVQRFVKLAYRVVFPMQLRLFNTSDDAQDPDKLYELYGIIVHIGAGPHHGHYVAIIKVGIRWFVFDDETISVIDEQDLMRYYGDTPGSGSAYVLFYQAVDLDMQSLGLPDVKAIRAEKAKARREASIKRQMHKVPIASPTKADMPFEVPSRTGTPSAEGRAGGLFGRRSNTISNSVSSTAMVPSSSEPAQPSDPSKPSGSWLNSIRGRKGSVSQNNNGAGQTEGEEASESINRRPSPSPGRSGVEEVDRQRSEDKDGTTMNHLEDLNPTKQARRANTASSYLNTNVEGDAAPESPAGWRRMTGISPRKPTEASTGTAQQASTRRRSTLSRAFGFGRKDD